MSRNCACAEAVKIYQGVFRSATRPARTFGTLMGGQRRESGRRETYCAGGNEHCLRFVVGFSEEELFFHKFCGSGVGLLCRVKMALSATRLARVASIEVFEDFA